MLCAVVSSLLVVLAALLALPVYQIVTVIRLFSTPANLHNDRCVPLVHPLLVGCEDGQVHIPSNTLYLACAVNITERDNWFPGGDRRKADPAIPAHGAIVALDLATNIPTRLALPPAVAAFSPHGLGIMSDPANPSLVIIHAVNHRINGSVIEMFEHTVGSAALAHLGTASNQDILYNINDVVPVGRTAFYATNDHGTRGIVMRKLEVYGRFAWASVVHYDSGKWKVAAKEIRYANGITSSADGSHIYVSALTTPEIRVYNRRSSNTLQFIGSIKLPYIPDNINMDTTTGDLYIGTFTNGLKLQLHVFDHSRPCPSAILRVSNNTDMDQFYGKKYNIQTVYETDGSQISGTSLGVVDPTTKRLYVSGIFTPHLLVCDGVVV
ncbi:hypothetical protein BC831DRAFT_458757 [Entophlyctis helioformis]|nr:hypothetical protein BC831DRAFT_458757 [Entophlyctis helioformis]